MDGFDQWLQSVLAVYPAPEPRESAVIAAVALALVLIAWPLVRLLITVFHELGHAVTAVLVGRRLSGIKVHSDTSGLTLSRGRPSGPGMVATLLAGYPAPALVGLGSAWLAGAGHSVGLLWLIVVVLALMLIKVRNVYGVVVVLVVGATIGLFAWYAPPAAAGWLADGIAWLLLLAAPRPVVELLLVRKPGSDAAQLASLTHLPQVIWALIWMVMIIAALGAGANWLLPGLLPGLVR